MKRSKKDRQRMREAIKIGFTKGGIGKGTDYLNNRDRSPASDILGTSSPEGYQGRTHTGFRDPKGNTLGAKSVVGRIETVGGKRKVRAKSVHRYDQGVGGFTRAEWNARVKAILG